MQPLPQKNGGGPFPLQIHFLGGGNMRYPKDKRLKYFDA